MARRSLIGTLLAALVVSACATPERVNNPRVFDDTAYRLTKVLSGEGLQFSYSIGNKHAVFPSSVHSERSLEEWHRLLRDGNLVPPEVDPGARPSKREMFEHEIATARYESATDNLVWVVFSHDRLLKLKLIDLRNTITISGAASSASRQAMRVLDVMNRNPDFFDAADFSVVRGTVSRLAAVGDEATARGKELEADICSGKMSCSNSILRSAARSFTRRLQHDMFLAGYPDERYVAHLTQEVRALRAARDYELYYFSFNAQAEAARVLRLERSLAREEERLVSQQQFRARYVSQLRDGGHATFNGYHTSLDRLISASSELESVASKFATGASDLPIAMRLLSQIEEELLLVDVSFDRFASLILSGYLRESEDYPWPD